MPNKLRLVLFLRLAFVLLACVVGCQPLDRIDVTGAWTGTFTYTNGPATGIRSSLRMDLTSDDGRVTGFLTLPSANLQEFQVPIVLGEINADTIILQASGTNDLVSPPADVTLALDGEVTAATMSGVGTHTINGTSYTLTWEAVLVPPPSGT